MYIVKSKTTQAEKLVIVLALVIETAVAVLTLGNISTGLQMKSVAWGTKRMLNRMKSQRNK